MNARVAPQPPDAETVAALLAEYRPLLNRAALRYYWLDLAELRAVWEDAVLYAHRTYRPGTSGLPTWTRKIFRQRISTLVRDSRNEPSIFGESLGEDPPVINGVNPERAFWAEFAMAELLKLPPRDQTILIAHLHGYTYTEIGEQLGVSHQCAHQKAQRAIAMLKERVGLGKPNDES